MTNWRAVGIGFLALLVASVLGVALPLFGHAAAGLVGGFVAGVIAGGGLLRGAWHGLLAGAMAGAVWTVVLAAVGGLLGVVTADPVVGAVGGAGVLVVGLLLSFVFALDSAVAGAVGGLLG